MHSLFLFRENMCEKNHKLFQNGFAWVLSLAMGHCLGQTFVLKPTFNYYKFCFVFHTPFDDWFFDIIASSVLDNSSSFRWVLLMHCLCLVRAVFNGAPFGWVRPSMPCGSNTVLRRTPFCKSLDESAWCVYCSNRGGLVTPSHLSNGGLRAFACLSSDGPQDFWPLSYTFAMSNLYGAVALRQRVGTRCIDKGWRNRGRSIQQWRSGREH